MTPTGLLNTLSFHQGRERGISAADLARVCDIPERQLRTLIGSLREEGIAICATPETGYYLAVTPEELQESCKFLHDSDEQPAAGQQDAKDQPARSAGPAQVEPGVTVMSTAHTHHCAICPKPVRPGLLMCACHWKLVPDELQQAVYRRWGSLNRISARDGKFMQVLKDYRVAREEAIQSVKATLQTTTGEPA